MNVGNPEIITVLSLCTGYGGLELGVALALENPLRVVAVEVEAYALANLVAKAEEGSLAVEALWPDLRTFPAERFRGCFDIVLAGYPCQPFSCAGKRQGTDDPRHLWPDIARIVAAVEPVWCFFENVGGHLSLGFPEVYRSLHDMGYSVEAGLFTAAEVGAPHRRQRLFIIARRELCGRKYNAGGAAIIGGHNSRASTPITSCSIKTAYGVADTERTEPGEGTVQGSQTELGRDRPAIKRAVVADAPALGIQGPEPERPALAGRQADEQGNADRWPARPGQQQYEWEEPRVVGDAEYAGQRRAGRPAQRSEQGFELQTEKAQSGVGRAAHGTAHRVDRLRLLGNGVVPQQAAKAFRYLLGKL